MTEKAPVLKYEFVKSNKEIFSNCKPILDLMESIKNPSRGCSSCIKGQLRARFKYDIGKYVVENRPLEILKALPENMIVCYEKNLIRVRDLI